LVGLVAAAPHCSADMTPFISRKSMNDWVEQQSIFKKQNILFFDGVHSLLHALMRSQTCG
jgi:hypothetical protein